MESYRGNWTQSSIHRQKIGRESGLFYVKGTDGMLKGGCRWQGSRRQAYRDVFTASRTCACGGVNNTADQG